MKKILLTVIFFITTVISGYFIFVWNPKVIPTEAVVGKYDIQEENSNISANEKNENKNMFKYKNKTLKEALSDSDKKSMLDYIDKLSFTDQILSKEYMEAENQYENIKLLVKILKSRFSLEEYNEIKSILTKYLEINEIEKVIG